MLGQLLILGVSGPTLTDQERELFSRIQPGGFVLFGRNFESPKQVRELTDSLREISYDDPIIAVDQEGGRVSRTREIGIEPPSAQDLREKGNMNLMAVHGEITADLLRLLGFNLCLAPVLDISYDTDSDNALKGRCWGTNDQEVITNAGVYNRYMRKRKMKSCAKHFPSCGLATVDPHHMLPQVDKTVDDLLASDLLPYTALMPELDSIMTCHAHFSAIDPDTPGLPGSLSHNLITRLLRYQLGYEGLIMTDDLDMGAIVNTYGRGNDVKAAIEAGNDMAMICHQVITADDALKALEDVDKYRINDSLERIAKFKKKVKPPTSFSEIAWNKLDAEIMKLRVDVLGEEKANEQQDYTNENRSPVEGY